MRRRPVVVALVVAALVLMLLVLYVLPAVLVGPDDKLTVAERLKSENDVRTTLLQALAGATLLVGLYFTGRTFHLNREGQVTERFTRAIDQLGSEKLDVRIGGIYALERLAHASRVDHWAIMEVLTTFVREHAAWEGDGDGELDSDQSTQLVTADDRPEPESIHPTVDVQTILNVLKRRRRDWDARPLDLRETDLRGADLEGAHFEWANLRSAHLDDANLRDVRLDHADLKEAHLTGANLDAATLTQAELWHAHLDDAFLNFADLEGANLDGASFAGTVFQHSNLREASFQMAPFAGANLNGADLRGSYLSLAHVNFARIDERTQLPSLGGSPEVRIWASKGVRGWFIVMQEPGAPPPTKASVKEFDEEIRYDSEFEDVTEQFVLKDQTT
jgi:uncharacterized protein YjbI with pentapeptide repeats